MSRMYILWVLRFKMHVLWVERGGTTTPPAGGAGSGKVMVWQRGYSGVEWPVVAWPRAYAQVGQEGRGVCEERQKTLFFAAVALKLTALLRRGRELEARNHLVNLRGRGAGNENPRSRTFPLSTRQALLRVACFTRPPPGAVCAARVFILTKSRSARHSGDR